MENKQPVKKLITRIAAGVLSAAFLVGFAAPAAFALDTTGGLTDDNASGGTNSGGGTSLAWKVNGNTEYGYFVTFVYSKSTDFPYTERINGLNTATFFTGVTLNSAAAAYAGDEGSIALVPNTISFHESLAGRSGNGELGYYSGGSTLKNNVRYMNTFGCIAGSGTKAKALIRSGSGLALSSEIADILGPPPGIANTMSRIIPANGGTEHAREILSAYASQLDTTLEGLAGMVNLDRDFMKGIIHEAGSDDLEVLKDYILPISSNCKVGWAMVVEPLYVWRSEGSDIGIDPDISNLFVTGTTANAVVAASAGYLDSIHKGLDAKNDAVARALSSGNAKAYDAAKTALTAYKKDYQPLLDIPNHLTMGMFESLYDSWNDWGPHNIYTDESWFGIPVASGSPYLGVIQSGGWGVGAVKNNAVPAVAPEEPENPPPVYTPPDVSFPVIEEDHLSQICETTVLESTSNKSDVCADFTFRPTAMSFSRI